MSHTKGEWKSAPTGIVMRDKYSQPFGVGVFNGQHRNLICGCFGDGEGGVEAAEANARLISAAPDLLEAGSRLFRLVNNSILGVGTNAAENLDFRNSLILACNEWRAAIAKAEGRS